MFPFDLTPWLTDKSSSAVSCTLFDMMTNTLFKDRHGEYQVDNASDAVRDLLRAVLQIGGTSTKLFLQCHCGFML